MDSSMGQLKMKYNVLLKRHDKAEQWINSQKSIDFKAREYIEYKKILIQINQLIQIAREEGHEMTHEEITGGFE